MLTLNAARTRGGGGMVSTLALTPVFVGVVVPPAPAESLSEEELLVEDIRRELRLVDLRQRACGERNRIDPRREKRDGLGERPGWTMARYGRIVGMV